MAEKQFDNVKINVEFSEENELKELNSGEVLSVLMGKLAKAVKSIISHFADNVKHITADERPDWNGKADKSEIPTSLPADGGNADTVGQYTPQQLIQSNLNLLDNPDFKINQRGMTEYSGKTNTVDRWIKTGVGVVIVEDEGITLDNTNSASKMYFYQEFERVFKAGDVVTISLYDASGVLHFTSGIFSGQANEPIVCGLGSVGNFYTALVKNRYEYTICIEPGQTITILNTKFELGNTPTPFVPPDPTLELLKCQRYYQVIDGAYTAPIRSDRYGCIWDINLPVRMRIKPSLILPTINDDTRLVASETINEMIMGGWSFGTSTIANTDNEVQIQLKNSDVSKYENAHLLFAANAPIALSADL